MQENNDRPILEVSNLRTHFHTEDGVVKAVDGIDFHVNAGEIMGLVGESGCGKTVTSLSIIGLVDSPGKVRGKIKFDGQTHQGNHQSLISSTLFNHVQNKLEELGIK